MPAAVTTSVPVEGMTCRTCERRIERHVRRLPDITAVAASASRARVEVVSTGPVSQAQLVAAIEEAGYRVGRTPWLAQDPRTWLAATLGLGVVVLIALGAEATGLLGVGSGIGDIRDGGLVVALLLGLAAGVSTCMALTGGLILALSAAFAASRPPAANAGVATRLRPSAVFVAGRIAGFAFLGAALGALGSTVVLPPQVVAGLMVAVAVVMTILGVRLTGLSPRIAGWSPTLPGGIAHRIGLDEGAAGTYTDGRAAVLGAATFFLPCGFTQAVQVYALSTGSPLLAGSIMAVFAIGTAPGLLALGGLPALVPARSRPLILRAIGVVVLGFAVVNGAAGLRLAGISPTFGPTDATGPVPQVAIEGGVQVLRTSQVGNGYIPADSAIYAGLPTRWIVDSLEPQSCAVFLQVPALNVAVTLRPGENTIDLPALEPGRISYSCSMGMYGGSLTVVARAGGAGAAVLPAPSPVVEVAGGVQVLRTFQLATGYLPADAALYAGMPTRWIVESLDEESCAGSLEVPSLGLSVVLVRGENAIELPALEPGPIAYRCSTGANSGQLTVVEAPGGSGEGSNGG
jgi:sulfite exporter TauE/SafE/copper chaperone CopZ